LLLEFLKPRRTWEIWQKPQQGAWLFEQQADDYTESALDALVQGPVVAPRWLSVEVLNVLLTLEKRGKLAVGKSLDRIKLLQRLPVRLVDSDSSIFELHDLLPVTN
jgi:predicted nucleic acid-binding protein